MIYRFHDCELDAQLYQLRRSGETVPLEPQVFRLLVYLLTHCDRVVSREELFEQLWPGQVVGDAALTYCVAKARKAVRDTGGQQRVIKTVHGHGYRLIASVLTSAPVSKKIIVPNAGHLPQMEKPEEFNYLVLDFLSR